MCGIVAAVCGSHDVRADVLAGLKTLEYRGYDSAGISNGKFQGIICPQTPTALPT